MENEEFSRHIEGLSSTDIARKRAAVRFFRTARNTMAVEPLLSNLQYPDTAFQKEVADALSNLKSPRAIGPLANLMFSTVDADMRLACLNAIQSIGVDAAADILLGRINEIYDEQVKLRILQVCAELKPDNAVFEKVRGFCDIASNIQIKAELIKIIGLKFHSEAAKNYLVELLKNSELSKFAAYALYDQEGSEVIKTLIFHLNRIKDMQTRKNIILALGDLYIDGTVEKLRPLLNSRIEELKAAAVESLGKLQDHGSEDEFIKNLSSEFLEVKIAAIRALHHISSKKASRFILPCLFDRNDDVAIEAYHTVIDTGDNTMLKEIKDLSRNQSDFIRRFVIEFCMKNNMYDDEIIKQVMGYLGSNEASVIAPAVEFLGKIQYIPAYEKVLGLLYSADEQIRFSAVNAVESFAHDDMVQVLKSMYERESSEKIRGAIITKIGYAGAPGIVDMMLSCLNDPDARVRSNVIEVLEQYGTEDREDEIVNAIFPCLNDSNNRVKGNAAKALWKFGGLRMLSILKEMLTSEKDMWQRASAAFILGEIGNMQVVKILLSAIADSEENVRRNVVKALGKTKDSSVIPVLKDRYNKETSAVREAIVESLGMIKDQESIPWIMDKIMSENSAVQVVAVQALGNMDGIVEKLMSYLEHTNPAVRREILKILGRKGSRMHIPILKLRLERETFEIKEYVKKAMNEIITREGGV